MIEGALLAAGEQARALVLHHRPADVIADVQISAHSRWKDKIWRFERHLPGQKRDLTTFNWEIEIVDGRLLTDPQFARLLDACKRLIWSLLVDRRHGKNLQPETAFTCFLGLKRLTVWMVKNDYRNLDDLRAESSLEYLEDLQEEAAAAEADLQRNRPFNKDDFTRALKVWTHLHQQREALLPAGIVLFEALPFGGRTTYDVAGQLAEDTASRVPPLPDEVAIPILQAAIRIVKFAAQDVLRAQEAVLHSRSVAGPRSGASNDSRTRRQNSALSEITFNIIPGEHEPWHTPLDQGCAVKRYMEKRTQVWLPPIGVLRHLIGVVRDACVIVGQGLIGVRINEFCSFKGGINPDTGLPSCIEIERSGDGLTDLYYVRGLLTKGRAAPEPARWLLGSRPASHHVPAGDDLPLPVIALCVLEELYRPWRQMADLDDLIVNFSSAPRALPTSAAAVATPSSETLRRGMKNFVLNYVDFSHLPDSNWRGEDLSVYRDTQGTIIRTHQWRKSFAHYVLLTRSNLLQAVSQHFKHLSLAMTEQGYAVDDPFLRGMLGEASLEATADFFYRASHGEPLAGRFGDLLQKHQAELREIGNASDEKSSKALFRKWALMHDVRIFHTEGGRCGIGLIPLKARCHDLAGTSHWSNKEPNYETREPAVCAGCHCYAIDRETSPFWTARHRENRDIYADAEALGLAGEYRVALRRAEQAAAIVRNLGIGIDDA